MEQATLLQSASNAVRAATVEWADKFLEQIGEVTPAHLDALQEKLFHSIKEQFPERVGRKFIRTQIVDVLIKEHGLDIFGVAPLKPKTPRPMPKPITDATIKKYTKKYAKKK